MDMPFTDEVLAKAVDEPRNESTSSRQKWWWRLSWILVIVYRATSDRNGGLWRDWITIVAVFGLILQFPIVSRKAHEAAGVFAVYLFALYMLKNLPGILAWARVP